jgi:hypothetical protein
LYLREFSLKESAPCVAECRKNKTFVHVKVTLLSGYDLRGLKSEDHLEASLVQALRASSVSCAIQGRVSKQTLRGLTELS